MEDELSTTPELSRIDRSQQGQRNIPGKLNIKSYAMAASENANI